MRGFGVFIACIALGVMAIAGVGSVAASLADGIAGAGRVILGGDLAFSLIQREASDAERAFLAAHGTVSVAATCAHGAHRATARSTLVEVKAVDAAYPLFGAVATDPRNAACRRCSRSTTARSARPSIRRCLTRLDLKAGDRITIGSATIEFRAALKSASRTSSPAASASARACSSARRRCARPV